MTMEKRQAREYIGKVLKSRFDQDQFALFVRNLLNEYEPRNNSYSGNLIPEAFREHISHYKRIGKYTDPEGEVLDILIVQTKTVKKLERARTALRNFVVRHLKTFEKQYALAAFYSKEDDGAEWRLSLVKIDYESQRNEDGKIKVKEDLVPAKRFSFLVGENEDAYTAQKQLLPLLTNDHSNPLVVAEKSGDGSIEGAFSVEKVTQEFYEQYKELYLKLSENTSLIQTLKQEGLDPVRFVKKLLGQIVFLYFLQKKGWLGVPKNGKMGEGSKRFLQDRFELTVANGQNYFNDFLRYLFYEALAHEHHDDGIRYYFKQLDCKIPFLNGGLFEADYHWEKANLDIPNSYFRNDEKNKAGDKGTGILDVFDRYNFTIKEDEPLEKEVAVDPEMLGKVFENLLDIKDRKSKGAFYTPREIVHYMCQESLIHYLDNTLKHSPPSKGGVPEGGSGFITKQAPEGGERGSIHNLPHLKTFRKKLRNNLTPAEAALWKLLQKKQLDGRKFRRQHSVANYILDFYCPSEKLAVELDGQGHFEEDQAAYDRERDLFLKHCGIKVLRFENKWVRENPEELLQRIRKEFGWWKKQEPRPADSSGVGEPPRPADSSGVGEPPRPADTPPLKGGELRGDIEQFIRYGHLVLEHETTVAGKGKETSAYKFKLPESIRKYARELDEALADIKICDPAIGSGAFPVGLLHEIVTARLVLNSFLQNPRHTPYYLKRHAIKESIYGVDIDASAIDIARLRLWLSMIVDEEDYDRIEALPNLDYKIVCGNSLIGLPDNAMRNWAVEEELEKQKEIFFRETDENKKKELRQQINAQIRKLLDSAEQFAGYEIDFDFKLYFSEVWHQKGGFDVVIGNPPYLRIQGIRKENPAFADFLVKNYQSATGSFDLYVCFAEKALSLTSPKGILNFIMPVKWTNSAFGKGLRKLMKQQKAVKKIISFSAYQVFNASTYTGIQSFQKGSKELRYLELDKDLPDNAAIQNFLYHLASEDFNRFTYDELTHDAWVLTSRQVAAILRKINRQSLRVSDVFKKIFQGIATSKDSVYFIMNAEIKDETIRGYSKELDSQVEIELGFVKPLLKGDQVHRYEKLHTNNYVIFPYNLVDGKAILMTESEIRERFPKGYAYLKENEAVLRGREKGRFNIDGVWFQFGRKQGIDYGGMPKLICPDISMGGNYSFDMAGEFYDTTTLYGYIKYDSIEHPYGFYLAVLNSNTCWYYLKNTGTVLANGYFRYMPRYVQPFPLPDPDKHVSELLALLSLYAIEIKKKDDIIYGFFETLIDALVFELYFESEFKKAGKEILKHLGDLKPINSPPSEGGVSAGRGGSPTPLLSTGRGGLKLSAEEKLAIIRSEFERLSHSDHPVRRALDTLDEVEEVRIIREALK